MDSLPEVGLKIVCGIREGSVCSQFFIIVGKNEGVLDVGG